MSILCIRHLLLDTYYYIHIVFTVCRSCASTVAEGILIITIIGIINGNDNNMVILMVMMIIKMII